MAAASEKRRCHYEVLGVGMDSTAEEIRSAYRKLALQLHPDKLIQSGLSQSEATAKFQELSHSYEVLSDPKERSWYDSHRSKILFTSADSSSSSSAVVPDLFSFFSNSAFSGYSSDNKKSFFKVYSDVFNRVYANELEFARRMSAGGAAAAATEEVEEAPAMGDLDSPYAQAAAFYAYWTGFSTVLDFSWAEPYDAAAGENRKSRRVMEEENKKARRKARREYSETVRGLAEFVKKRDKRVIDMAVKKKEAEERRRAEERDRRKREEKARLERAMAYQEPEWARANDDVAEDDDDDVAEEEVEEIEELYCVACGKRFKSDKQWKNHERSKKHRENVDRIRKEVVSDDDDVIEEEEQEPEDKNKDEDDVFVEELEEMMRDKARVEVEEEEEEQQQQQQKDNDEIEIDNVVVEEEEQEQEQDKKYEDEIGVLEAMLGGRRNRKKAVALDKNDDEVMEYNDRKSTRKSRRRAKKGNNNENGTKNGEEEEKDEEEEEKEKLVVEKKGINAKNEATNGSKSKASSKGKKAKGGSKNSSNNECEKCGEEFESRTKLHKHLSDTGHASLKYR